MIAFKMECRRSAPLFSNSQWLWIAARIELTRRELDIVRLVFEDLGGRAIARELEVTVNTIHTQLKRLYLKLGVTSRVGLVLQIVREHLADSQEAEQPQPTVRLHHGSRKAA
ncbi:MAG: LuxR C-terminal-related transcriptional regulator [Planctomycetota bacterium]